MQEVFDKLEKDLISCELGLKSALDKISTGRAHPRILNQITIEYYGAQTPLSQVANISVEDARTLVVVPFEKGNVAKIEKAIIDSNMGFNPQSAGMNIRIPLPVLTEERRKDLVKLVGDVLLKVLMLKYRDLCQINFGLI